MMTVAASVSAKTCQLRGLRVANLKNLDIEIPLGKLTVVTGESGSGKSSFAIRGLFNEGRRRYLEALSPSLRLQLASIERADLDAAENLPFAGVSLSDASASHGLNQTVLVASGLESWLRQLFVEFGEIHCRSCQQSVPRCDVESITGLIQSFDTGTKVQLGLVVEDSTPNQKSQLKQLESHGFTRSLKLEASTFVIIDRVKTGTANPSRLRDSLELAMTFGLGTCSLLVSGGNQQAGARDSQPVELEGVNWQLTNLTQGHFCASCGTNYESPHHDLFRPRNRANSCEVCAGRGFVIKRRKGKQRSNKQKMLCTQCSGTGLGKPALAVHLDDKNWIDIELQSIRQLHEHLLTFADQATRQHETEQLSRLKRSLARLISMNLGDLTLGTRLNKLGTDQILRLRFAAQLQHDPTDILAVFDEPFEGLHENDFDAIKELLQQLREQRNTVVIVSHREELWDIADHLIVMGPGAGTNGGQVVRVGPPSEARTALAQSNSDDFLKQTAGSNNPKLASFSNIQLPGTTIPKLEIIQGTINILRGPSGVGKTRLLEQVIPPTIAPSQQSTNKNKKLCEFKTDQPFADCLFLKPEALSHRQRGAVATYAGLFDAIRKLFAETLEAKSKNFTPGAFSFLSKQGRRCLTCEGRGQVRHSVGVLPRFWAKCPTCHGTRYEPVILEIKYRGLNIHEVLKLTVEEAFPFFRREIGLQKKLMLLKQFCLDYVPLGHPLIDLSTGEWQRFRMANLFAGKIEPKTLFLLDRPSQGLHPNDLTKLMNILQEQVHAAEHTILLADNHPSLRELQAANVIELP